MRGASSRCCRVAPLTRPSLPLRAPSPRERGEGTARAHPFAVRLVLCTAGGSLLILAVAVDLVWTTLGTHGGGPLTGHAMRVIWRGIIALHGRRDAHRLLSFA